MTTPTTGPRPDRHHRRGAIGVRSSTTDALPSGQTRREAETQSHGSLRDSRAAVGSIHDEETAMLTGLLSTLLHGLPLLGELL
jgi:hypothetical protein